MTGRGWATGSPSPRDVLARRGLLMSVGLGLAIVKSITQAHDGELILTARAAGGLRVTVQLRRATAQWRLTRVRSPCAVPA